MNRPHLRWCDYDNDGYILPDGYKRLKDGTIINTIEMTEELKESDHDQNRQSSSGSDTSD